MNKKNPPKWTDIYPIGTPEGDDECKFFRILARNPKYEWMSIAAISKESGLSRERAEQIITKYYKKKMIHQNPANNDQWGYWERVPEMVQNKPVSAATINKNKRIDDVINGKSMKDIVKQYWLKNPNTIR